MPISPASSADITRAANRANTTIYTIDPRGLVAGRTSTSRSIRRSGTHYVRKSQDSMRVLAEETGGLAVVNMNDFDKALKQIDAASSDYYVLGYYSSNPDPTKRRRKIEVKVARRDANVFTRKEYVLKPPPKPTAPCRRCRRSPAFFIFASPRPGSYRPRPPLHPFHRFRQIRLVDSAPTKFTPSRAHATAVLPRPVNGSMTRLDSRQRRAAAGTAPAAAKGTSRDAADRGRGAEWSRTE